MERLFFQQGVRERVWGVKYVARTPLIQNKIEIFFRKNTIFIITPQTSQQQQNEQESQ